MGAFNWIIFESTCVACGQTRRQVCQTYMAADFNGDANGRFCDGRYHIGEPMRWWLREHPAYREWRQGNRKEKSSLPEDEELECNYFNCSTCNAASYVVLSFRDCTPVAVVAVGLEEHWPAAFYK